MTGRYDHVLSFVLEHPWNLERPMLRVVAGILARRMAGQSGDDAAIAAALVDRKQLPPARAGSVAIIPVYGVIAPRMNLFSEFSGGTTFENLSRSLAKAMANPDVSTILLDIDSPGGSVAGNAEFAAEVMKARATKRVIAQIQYTGASAAYMVAAACSEIVAAPSARIGSIGTYAILEDLSGALEQLGVKETFIFAGEGKDDNNVGAPPSAGLIARTQKSVDLAYGQFVTGVVNGRGKGVTPEKVRGAWKAFVYGSEEALAIGMIDSVGTLNDTLTRVLSAGGATDQRAARTLRADTTTTTTTTTTDDDLCPDCHGSGLKPEKFMGDPEGQQPCPTCNGTGKKPIPTDDTAQERASATAQDPTSDAQWQNGIDAALLELDL
jgi:signal peptide peptidase SppA